MTYPKCSSTKSLKRNIVDTLCTLGLMNIYTKFCLPTMFQS